MRDSPRRRALLGELAQVRDQIDQLYWLFTRTARGVPPIMVRPDLYERQAELERALGLDRRRPRRNPDDDLRDLERRAAAGDPHAARLLQRELSRRGLPQSDASRAALTRPELYLLCSLRLWAGSTWAMSGGLPPASLQSAVRGVARRQGISTPDLNRATKLLVERGLLEKGGVRTGAWIRLTEAGVAASEQCEGLELPPWDWRNTFPRVTFDPSNWEQVANAAVTLARIAASIPDDEAAGTRPGPLHYPTHVARERSPVDDPYRSGYQRRREVVLDRIRVLRDMWSRTTPLILYSRQYGQRPVHSSDGPEGTPDRIRFHFLYDLWKGASVEDATLLMQRRLAGEDV